MVKKGDVCEGAVIYVYILYIVSAVYCFSCVFLYCHEYPSTNSVKNGRGLPYKLKRAKRKLSGVHS